MSAPAWLRLHRSLLNNHKVQSLEPTLFKTWVNLLCIADDQGELPNLSEMSFALRLSEKAVKTRVSELIEARLIDAREASLCMHDWEDHQFRSDSSTERVRAFRKRRGNVSQNRFVTPPDTETDTETEDIVLAKAKTHPADAGKPPDKPQKKNRHPRKVEPYPEAFEALWKAYKPIASPASSKAEAHKAWIKLSPEDRDACQAGLARYVGWLSEEKQRRRDTPAKHLATFVNKRGWEPFLEGQTLVPSIVDEHPDIPPEKLAEILADIEREFGGARIR